MRKLIFLLLLSLPAAFGQGKVPDPCALINKADVKEASGKDVSDGKLTPNSGGPICEFKVGDLGAFSLLVRQAGLGETPDKIVQELKKRKIDATEAPGIGDRSFFTSPGYGMIQLNTFKGSTYLIVTLLIPGTPEAAERTVAEKAMRKALSKL
jgi:hypothetical protein